MSQNPAKIRRPGQVKETVDPFLTGITNGQAVLRKIGMASIRF